MIISGVGTNGYKTQGSNYQNNISISFTTDINTQNAGDTYPFLITLPLFNATDLLPPTTTTTTSTTTSTTLNTTTTTIIPTNTNIPSFSFNNTVGQIETFFSDLFGKYFKV